MNTSALSHTHINLAYTKNIEGKQCVLAISVRPILQCFDLSGGQPIIRIVQIISSHVNYTDPTTFLDIAMKGWMRGNGPILYKLRIKIRGLVKK